MIRHNILWQTSFKIPKLNVLIKILIRKKCDSNLKHCQNNITFKIFHGLLSIFPLWLKIQTVRFSCSVVSHSYNSKDCSMPSLPVHHRFPGLAQSYVHQVGDAIQPSHPLSSPLPRTFNLSQHQGLFRWPSGGQSIGISASGSVLPMNIQDWFPLWWTAWISLQSKGLSRVFSNTTVQKHQFFGTQLSL